MITLKTAAMGYEKMPKTKNIADLEIVDTTMEIREDGSGMDKDGEPFTYKYLVLNGEEYRVPDSVLSQLQDILGVNPNLQKFKVKKTGQGLQTRYQVVPIL